MVLALGNQQSIFLFITRAQKWETKFKFFGLQIVYFHSSEQCFEYAVSFMRLQVWAVLRPGFLALLDDPFDTKLLDIVIFKILPISSGKDDSRVNLAYQIKERNPLRYTFKVNDCSTLYLSLFFF